MRVSKRRAIFGGMAAALVAICAIAAGMAAIRARTRPPEMSLQERFLAGVPCAPPCWEDITPGVTAPADVEGILLANPLIERVEAVKRESGVDSADFVSWISGRPPDMIEGGVILGSAGVEEVNIIFRDLCIGEVIEAHGEPDCIAAERLELGDIGQEHRTAALVWLDKGMAASFGTFTYLPPFDFDMIDANVCGTRVQFFPLGDLPDYLGALAAWHGYDRFEAYLVSEGGCG
jgi:hypothetical protein